MCLKPNNKYQSKNFNNPKNITVDLQEEKFEYEPLEFNLSNLKFSYDSIKNKWILPE